MEQRRHAEVALQAREALAPRGGRLHLRRRRTSMSRERGGMAIGEMNNERDNERDDEAQAGVLDLGSGRRKPGCY